MSKLMVHSRAFRETWISAVVEAGRRVLENARVDSFDEAIMIETVDRPGSTALIRNNLRQHRFPPQTVVRREPRCDLPAVGQVEVDSRVVDLLLVRHT